MTNIIDEQVLFNVDFLLFDNQIFVTRKIMIIYQFVLKKNPKKFIQPQVKGYIEQPTPQVQ